MLVAINRCAASGSPCIVNASAMPIAGIDATNHKNTRIRRISSTCIASRGDATVVEVTDVFEPSSAFA